MELKQLEKTMVEIGGHEFYISPFPAFKAANLSGELADVLAPIFAAIVPLIDSLPDGAKTDLKDVDLTKASGAIANVRISGDRMEVLMRKLLLGGNIVVKLVGEDGTTKPERLTEDLANELFCGDVQDMFSLCFKVIQINFGGFFGKLGNLSGKVSSLTTMKTGTPRPIF